MKKSTLGILLSAVLLLSGNIAFAQPTISGLSLSASSGDNLTNDNLNSSYSIGGSTVETAEAWYRNGSPEATLYLPFEGGAINALSDFSGSNNDAILSSNASLRPAWGSTAGYNGHGAFTFDGDDYLYVGDALPLDASYTKTAWIYSTGLSFRNIMSSDFYGSNNHFLKIDNDGRLNAGHRNGSAVVIGRDSLFNDVWYFVAVSYDYDTREMVLYLDGRAIDRDYVEEAYRSVADPTVLIGSMAYTSEWEGRIDEPSIFAHAMSPEQVYELYDYGRGRIHAAETSPADVWHVEVTPFSATAVGSTSVSNSITIAEGPELSGLTLEASSTEDLTVDDLSVSFSENLSVVETATAWFKNGTPEAMMRLPFEAGYHNALLDFSGSDNHATYPDDFYYRPRWIDDGGPDGSGVLMFGGNDYLVAGTTLPQDADYTKTAWIYPTGAGTGFRNIMSSDYYSEGNHYLKLDEQGHLVAGQNTGQLTVRDPVSTSTITWYFVAVTFDFETGEMILYKNGIEVDRAILLPAERSVTHPTILIGAMAYTVEFMGRIDEPSLYDRVLSPEQIQSLYANGNNTLVSEETHGSDNWNVEVTPFSNYEIGSTLTSNILLVHSTIVSDIPDQTIDEGSLFNPINLNSFVEDHEYSDNELTWDTHGESELIVTINSSNSASISMPNGDWIGMEDIYFVATNPYGDADSTEVTFTVQSVNDAPVIGEIGAQNTDEDITLTNRTVSFTDPDASDSHTITVVSGNTNVTVENLSGNINGSTYDLVPVPDWNGSAEITVTVTDNGIDPLSDIEVYTLTVDPINDVVILSQIGDQNTIEDVALTGLSVDFTDPDVGDTHTISVISLEANVTVVGPSGNTSGSTYDLVPADNWSGTAQITVTVTETVLGGLSDTEIYAFAVGAVNDPPVLTKIGDQSIDEDNSVLGLAVDFSDLDPTDEHTITVVSSETGVSIANLIGNTSGSTYDLVPDADWNGSTQITVTVTDNGTVPLSDIEVYTYTVNSINDAPALINLSNDAIDEGVAIGTIVGVLGSTDVDISDTHSYQFMFEGGDEETDNLFFEIVGEELRVLAELDYETKNTFALLIQSDDGNGGTLTQQVPVTVNNVVETGIGDENESLSFKVYPVPAVDQLTVEVDNPENAKLLLEIYSNAGVLLHSEHTVHGNTIDLSDFSKGMYILRIQGERVSETRKIIVGD